MQVSYADDYFEFGDIDVGRIRRKRCNGTKPACVRCTSTGRRCDFTSALETAYVERSVSRSVTWCDTGGIVHQIQAADQFGIHFDQPLLIQGPRLLGHVCPHEVDYFEYFRTECTEEFSGFFNSILWKQLVLQAAHSEPFILQAVLAIGAFRRSQLILPCSASKCDPNILEYCMGKYTIASRELGQRIKTGTADWKLAVLGSLVFLAIEVLQGHESGALMHLGNGIAILQGQVSPSAKDTSARYPNYRLGAETEDLVAAFTRLSVEEFPFFDLRTFVPPAIPGQPIYFADLKDTRLSLNSIVTAVYNSIRRHGTNDLQVLPLTPLPHTVAAEIARLQETLKYWFQVFENLLFLQEYDIENSVPASVLKLQYLVIWIKVSVYFLFDETAYDQYLPLFEEVVERSERVIEANMRGSSKLKGPCFILDIAIAQPLYFVTRKYQEPTLRRKAIGVMKKVGQEGVYTGRTIAKIAEWIVATEERVDSAGTEVIERRFHNVSFDFHPDTRTATVLATRRTVDGMWEQKSTVLDLV
jgi:hypothetical protein